MLLNGAKANNDIWIIMAFKMNAIIICDWRFVIHAKVESR